ncbi:hypothetical protein C8R43DRAFT_1141325 [Mycena crocata]|nr:hypothetical protein C8R43DRAFT_1141318 [Mycena crocata]KAJ7100580.1 hypothetical protein C8R43DRAFT_1141325 [Mycena crocata]
MPSKSARSFPAATESAGRLELRADSDLRSHCRIDWQDASASGLPACIRECTASEPESRQELTSWWESQDDVGKGCEAASGLRRCAGLRDAAASTIRPLPLSRAHAQIVRDAQMRYREAGFGEMDEAPNPCRRRSLRSARTPIRSGPAECRPRIQSAIPATFHGTTPRTSPSPQPQGASTAQLETEV